MRIDTIGFGYEPRAPFATMPQSSRGRLVPEDESPTRTPFQRDRDRIIHSNAFRRLKHKTQVFVAHEGDHYRTRLTHTIEVSQIARALARALRLDEELAEAIALVHDFGHTPFGHAGEDALDAAMADFGGFDHNAQTLRIVTALEHRYARFDGLNLTWETLEGIVKHNGPLLGRYGERKNIPEPVLEFNSRFDLKLDQFAGPEAQCAAIADDIAYNAHDLDDGLRSGLIVLDQLEDVPLAAALIADVRSHYCQLDVAHFAYELVRRQITLMVEDVIGEAIRRINNLDPEKVDDIYKAGCSVVSFSEDMADREKVLKKFLYQNLYFHESVLVRRRAGEKIVADLFAAYMNTPSLMPAGWYMQAYRHDQKAHARVVSDFLSGMTDNYAMREHQRLFDRTPDLF